jgi:hypothetical protein
MKTVRHAEKSIVMTLQVWLSVTHELWTVGTNAVALANRFHH